MKSLSDAAFFRVFDALADAGNPGLKLKSWSFDGADWRRERYSIAGADYSLVVEVFTIHHSSRPRWKFIAVKEHWWGEEQDTAIRNARWARPVSGRRTDILEWFRKQERAADRAASGPAASTA